MKNKIISQIPPGPSLSKIFRGGLTAALLLNREPREDFERYYDTAVYRNPRNRIHIDQLSPRFRDLMITHLSCLHRWMRTDLFDSFCNETMPVQEHGLPHALNVLCLAASIMDCEPAPCPVDDNLLVFCALSHDLSNCVGRENHEEYSSLFAQAIFEREHRDSPEQVSRSKAVADIIRGHAKIKKPDELRAEHAYAEARLLHDADNLACNLSMDRMYGIARKNPRDNYIIGRLYQEDSVEDRRAWITAKVSGRLTERNDTADFITRMYLRNVLMITHPGYQAYYITRGARAYVGSRNIGISELISFFTDKLPLLRTDFAVRPGYDVHRDFIPDVRRVLEQLEYDRNEYFMH